MAELARATPRFAERDLDTLTALADRAQRIAPVTMAGEHRLPIIDALQRVFPDGLQRGSVVGIGGPGALSLALAVAAGPLQADAWAAMVGCDDVCLAAAGDLGVPLHRLVVVDQPERASWSSVVGALCDAFAVVMVAPRGKIRTGDVRKLRTRARQCGTVLVDLSGAWPEAHDVSLRVVGQRWEGLGSGSGVLRSRRVEIDVAGRRARPRRAELCLPDVAGAIAIAEPVAEPVASPPQVSGYLAPVDAHHAGADLDHLDRVDRAPTLPTAG